MAYDAKRLTSRDAGPFLRRAEYSHGTDTKANMKAGSYFNSAWAALPKGTIIDCVAALDSTPVLFSAVVTASSESGGVTIAEANYV